MVSHLVRKLWQYVATINRETHEHTKLINAQYKSVQVGSVNC